MFDVVLERVARGRPERSLVLTGLRGVGKTILLNTLRSQAIGRLWGTGKIEARTDQPLRRPLSAARTWRYASWHPDTARPTALTNSWACSKPSRCAPRPAPG